ncbi:hypothetical protein SAMN02745215_03210 [Desulfitobacterium chlororespirans DSM 11544]|uniref:Uncharacterized protein n=1 Tax=Desulfitobacterium chlororespirans DSM 11544 TaxID=1121395 RepID=A0A1M7U985_9FIRM|nr:hypothetical protein SAMN02745215_03210 [Desulfitobacterium chlororespirans DSM 11544]
MVSDFAVTRSIDGGEGLEVVPSDVHVDESEKVVTLTVDPVVATTEDQSVVYSVSYKSGTPVAAPAVTVVKIPVISNVSIASNNADNTKAMIGDTITLTFTADRPVYKLSNFKLNGSNPDSFTNVGNVYTATHIVDEGDLITGEPASFQINVKDDAGIYSQTVESTTDSSSVTIIPKYARLSNIHIYSSNVNPSIANLGDTITVTFESDEAVTKLSDFKINGSNPATFVNIGNLYAATHVIDEGDKDGNATFQINVKNASGIYTPTLETTTDESSVVVSGIALHLATEAVEYAEDTRLQDDVAAAKLLVDALPADVAPDTSKANLEARLAAITAPVISNITVTSNNANNTKAMNGDTITLTFTSSQPIEKLGNFKINGSNPDTFTHEGNVYTATHLVDSGDSVTGDPITFQINVKNEAGIYSQTVEATTDGSSVTIIDKYARISNVKIYSTNADSTIATDGDTVILTFTTDEAVTALGNFKICGSNPNSFSNTGNTYIVTHLVDSGDTPGTATFQINVENAQGIYSPTLEATTDGSTVVIQ